jgi:transcriptional regulator
MSYSSVVLAKIQTGTPPTMPEPSEILQGTLDMLVLRTLALGPMHGLGVSDRIRQITRGVFVVKPGSLFPALYRLDQNGWIKGHWGESENNRKAKYYTLTPSGRAQLTKEKRKWNKAFSAVNRLLEGES